MKNWLDQFSVRYESIDDCFSTPAWFTKHVLIGATPGPQKITEDLWRTADGFYASTLTSFYSAEKGDIIEFSEPAVMLIFIAKSAEAVQWHRHKAQDIPTLPALEKEFLGFPPISYGELHQRFECTETASYRASDGLFIDKKVSVGLVSFCFRNTRDKKSEHPFLIELRGPVGKPKNIEPNAAPNSRQPSQLPPSSEIRASDSQRTPSSGGCG